MDAISSSTDLGFLTIAEASTLIRSRKLSPVDLATQAFQRISALDGQLNDLVPTALVAETIL